MSSSNLSVLMPLTMSWSAAQHLLQGCVSRREGFVGTLDGDFANFHHVQFFELLCKVANLLHVA